MRWRIGWGLLLLLVGGITAADDPPRQPWEIVADQVLVSLAANDADALERLAAAGDPDPWLVADALLARGEGEAAAAFASAATSREARNLSTYVDSVKDLPDASDVRTSFRDFQDMLRAGNGLGASSLLRELAPPAGTVLEVLVLEARQWLMLWTMRLDDAAEASRRASAAARAIGWLGRAAEIRFSAGHFRYMRTDFAGAEVEYRAAIELLEELGWEREHAEAVHNLGNVVGALGRAEEALEVYARASALSQAQGDLAGVAACAIDAATVFSRRDALHEAFDAYEQGLEAAEASGQRAWTSNALEGLGNIYSTVGMHARAKDIYIRSLAIREELEAELPIANSHFNLGLVARGLGQRDEAVAHLERALEMRRRQRAVAVVLETLLQLARVHLRFDEPEPARERAAQALRLANQYGRTGHRDLARRFLGTATLQLGDPERAIELLDVERARSEGEGTPLDVDLLVRLVEAHRDAGHVEEVLAFAWDALVALDADATSRVGLRDGLASSVPLADVVAAGTRMLLERGDLDEAFSMVEAARGRALLHEMVGHRAVRDVLANGEMRAAEGAARAWLSVLRAAGTIARAAVPEATDRSSIPEIEEAEDRFVVLCALHDRAARRQTSWSTPRPAEVPDLEAVLKTGEVFVLYALTEESGSAWVVTAKDMRHVELGPATELLEAARDLPSARASLVEPLALDGPADVVLVCPDPLLAALPYAALFERPVALLPSATIFDTLRKQGADPGTGTLGVGRRRGSGTGAWCTARDVEANLVRRRRWRCIDIDAAVDASLAHPMRCALDLSGDGRFDNRWRVAEILRNDIQADLVILRGDETARGIVYAPGGTLGLPQIFLAAGASRVIGSLWEVDDDARDALWAAFHARWRPATTEGPSVAEALHAAQQHVRAQEKWSDPIHWAGWVLWGLP